MRFAVPPALLATLLLGLASMRAGVASGDPLAAGAAPVPQHCSEWQTFGPGDGLPARVIYDLAFDGEELWAATEFGLVHGRPGHWGLLGAAQGLPGELQYALATSPEGEIWTGGPGGLARVSAGRVDAFRSEDSGLPGGPIYDVALVGDAVWVAAAGGIASYDRRTGSWSVWLAGTGGLPRGGVARLFAGTELWAAPLRSGLLRFSASAARWEPEDLLARSLAAPVAALSQDERGVWLGAWKETLRWEAGALGGGASFDGRVRALAQRGSLLWVGSDAGLSVYDGKRWGHYRRRGEADPELQLEAAPGLPAQRLPVNRALPGLRVSALAIGAGELWVGTGEGLGRCAQPQPSPAALAGPARPAPPSALPPGLNPGRLGQVGAQIHFGLLAPGGDSPSVAAVVAGLQLGLSAAPVAGAGPRSPRLVLAQRRPQRAWPGDAAAALAGLVHEDGARVVLALNAAADRAEVAAYAEIAEIPLLRSNPLGPVSVPPPEPGSVRGPRREIFELSPAAGVALRALLGRVPQGGGDVVAFVGDDLALATSVGLMAVAAGSPGLRLPSPAELADPAALLPGILLWGDPSALLPRLELRRPGQPCLLGPEFASGALLSGLGPRAEGCWTVLPLPAGVAPGREPWAVLGRALGELLRQLTGEVLQATRWQDAPRRDFLEALQRVALPELLPLTPLQWRGGEWQRP